MRRSRQGGQGWGRGWRQLRPARACTPRVLTPFPASSAGAPTPSLPPPQDLVRAATVNCARLFMMDDQLGRVQVGSWRVQECWRSGLQVAGAPPTHPPSEKLRHGLPFSRPPPCTACLLPLAGYPASLLPVQGDPPAASPPPELPCIAHSRAPAPPQAGYQADLLLVDGDPLRDIALLADPRRRLKLILKGGRVVKHAL